MRFGGWVAGLAAVSSWSPALGASVVTDPVVIDAPAAPVIESAAPATAATLPVAATLAAGTPVLVMLDTDLSTMTAMLGDRFSVVVLRDVVDRDTVVIPQGTTGFGEVTFTTNKGGFGKPGIIGIALRQLQIGDRRVALSGRYREEGQSKAGATAATYFVVGPFAGFIKGKPGVIPRGRELKARTGEPIAFTVGVSTAPPPPPIIDTAILDTPPEPATPEAPAPVEIRANNQEQVKTGGLE